MTPAELRELLKAATPGPWYVKMRDVECNLYADALTNQVADIPQWTSQRPKKEEARANAALIVAAVNALPRLLAIIEAADAVRADLPRGDDRTDNERAYDERRREL